MRPVYLVLFCALPMALAAPAARFDLSHLAKLVRVSDPQIAPDGKAVAAVVTRPNYEDNRQESSLVLINPYNFAQTVLTRDRRGASSPRWSPRGERIAFLANAGPAGAEKPQVFLMSMTGGDAWQLTKSPTGVQQFSWRPDGRMIAYVAADEALKRTGEERHNDSFEVRNNDFLVTRQPMPSHLWLIAATGGEAKRLTSGSWTLPISFPPSSPASPVSWSPDGKLLAFVKVASPYSGDFDQSSIQVLDVAAGNFRPLTSHTKNESQPLFSPDGKRLVYWYPRDGETKNVSEAYVTPAAGGDNVNLTRGIDRNIARVIWMPDGKSLLTGANDRTSVGLWHQPLDGPAHRIDTGRITPASAFWVDVSVGPNGEICFSGSEPQRPSELYFLSKPGVLLRRITDFNNEVAGLELAKTETIEWEGPNGFHQNGVLTYPQEFNAANKYPLVLLIHGGPRSASKEAFSRQAQLMAAKGWVVFEPNYRGSDNLGNAFQSAIWNDAGEGPGRDVMSGVETLKRRGFVDESRMAVSGWSYGGYMTTWLLGHYPGIWKVAVAGAAVTDWSDQYNLGDSNVRRGQALGGSPWTDNRMQAYIDQSPITFANRIRTPTLIMSDTGDYRVPVTQSYRLYHALKDNGVTTKFIAYPVGGHSPTDPVRSRDVDRRWIGWLAQYLNGESQPTGE